MWIQKRSLQMITDKSSLFVLADDTKTFTRRLRNSSFSFSSQVLLNVYDFSLGIVGKTDWFTSWSFQNSSVCFSFSLTSDLKNRIRWNYFSYLALYIVIASTELSFEWRRTKNSAGVWYNLVEANRTIDDLRFKAARTAFHEIKKKKKLYRNETL